MNAVHHADQLNSAVSRSASEHFSETQRRIERREYWTHVRYWHNSKWIMFLLQWCHKSSRCAYYSGLFHGLCDGAVHESTVHQSLTAEHNSPIWDMDSGRQQNSRASDGFYVEFVRVWIWTITNEWIEDRTVKCEMNFVIPFLKTHSLIHHWINITHSPWTPRDISSSCSRDDRFLWIFIQNWSDFSAAWKWMYIENRN